MAFCKLETIVNNYYPQNRKDMKKIMNAVQAWWKRISEESRRQKQLKRERNIKCEALVRLQVREFNGKIYLCFDNVPILTELELLNGMSVSVEIARENYLEYRLLNDGITAN